MRHSKTCPKCASTDILRLPEKTHGDSPMSLSNWWPTLAWTTHYVCGACGYTERWVESPEDLRKIREKFPPSDSSAAPPA